MPVYLDKQTNQYYVQFDYQTKTYKKRFHKSLTKEYAQDYEKAWRKELAEKDFRFVKMQIRDADTDVSRWLVKFEESAKKSGKAIKSGLVYVLKFADAYKIGFTTNLEKRLREFTVVVLPYEPEVILKIYTQYPFALEKMLHKRFENKRLKGEWFKLTLNDLLFLRKVEASFTLLIQSVKES